MQELRELLRGTSDSIPLDVAALQIGCIEYPQLEPAPFLEILDSHAAELGERVDDNTSDENFIALLNEYLFEELGFQGNSLDYYDPANSCLQQVLMRRLGIPISLSVLYMEIGRRLGRTLHGIGLPGHFIVSFESDGFQTYLDPFHAGQTLTVEECFSLAREATSMPLAEDQSMLQPVSNRHIVIRMLNNLRAIYFRRREPTRAVRVLDLLIEAMPNSAEEYKQRGVCLVQVDRFRDARQDLETYLRLAPDAMDRPQVSAELDRIRRLISLQS